MGGDTSRVTGGNPTGWYDTHAGEAADRYESLAFRDVHGWLIYLLPEATESLVLDIGAGSGRDAAWFARRGHEVIAVEPSAAMRREGQRRHPNPRIHWVDDRLPALAKVSRLGTDFDIILLSAVWVHVPPMDRARAFRKLVNQLKPGGLLAITLRHGPADPDRAMHEVKLEELERLAREHGGFVERIAEMDDLGNRPDIHWTNVAIRLPDDGTGALPLLRHVILNDAKSSTYKLALLRTLCRIADGAGGMANDAGESHVSVPMGLVALTWLRLFHPLIGGGFPQMPEMIDGRGPGFVKEPFRRVLKLSALDLRIGMRFSGENAKALHQSLKDARHIIATQPVHYMTYPNGGQILEFKANHLGRPSASLVLDEPYLLTFGELKIPWELWHTLQRFSVWVEPAIVAEWRRLMHDYALRAGRKLDERDVTDAMAWSDPGRDVRLARERVLELLDHGDTVRCVWSNRRITPNNLDVDHCFPWTAWPCNDLWNLLPTHRKANSAKSARLPDAATMERAAPRIMKWWDEAYEQAENRLLAERFIKEARATLPTLQLQSHPSLDNVYEAVHLRRIRLKRDQQVPEWHG